MARRTSVFVAFAISLIALTRPRAGWAEGTSPHGGIDGIVTADGKPLAGAKVVLWRGVPSPGSSADTAQVARGLALLEGALRDDPIVGTTTTDAGGRFGFDAIEPGIY